MCMMKQAQGSPIRKAVEPLIADAQKWAAKMAREHIAKVIQELVAADWDLEKAAPYPRSMGVSRADFTFGMRRFNFFRAITTPRKSSRNMHEPNFCDRNPAAIEKIVKEARKDAAAKYEAFIEKLEQKVGAHTSAKLQGNHVWGWSFLTVETPSGEQIWKTRQITNVSVLGLYFPQWPSRKVKKVDA